MVLDIPLRVSSKINPESSASPVTGQLGIGLLFSKKVSLKARGSWGGVAILDPKSTAMNDERSCS